MQEEYFSRGGIFTSICGRLEPVVPLLSFRLLLWQLAWLFAAFPPRFIVTFRRRRGTTSAWYTGDNAAHVLSHFSEMMAVKRIKITADATPGPKKDSSRVPTALRIIVSCTSTIV